MCGISGEVHRDQSYPVSMARVLATRDALTPRGPDDAGQYVGPGVALGARRLAILDLSARGHMPMSTPDGRYWITYNGEVYNHRELRAGLEGHGHTFVSSTDTEVVLALYAAEGAAMLHRLNGMFAFAVWDSHERTLFLARDRLGVKPLYYAATAGSLYFASEQKALFESGIRASFDDGTWEELLCFRYIAGENTPFEGVKRLLPGHYVLWRDGAATTRRWWNLAERARDLREDRAADDYPHWYRETFDHAVSLHRISDVPVGVLLSGGVDSGSIAASLARQSDSEVSSFTVRFAEAAYDEGQSARQVAESCRLRHHELEVPEDDLMARLEEASWLNDEPLAHGSDLHLLAISKYAKNRVTVLLSGEGADETLGGYVRYRPLRHPALLGALRPVANRVPSSVSFDGRLGKLMRFLAIGSAKKFVLFNACDVLPADLESLGVRPTGKFPYRERVLAEAQAIYAGDYMRQAMYSDQHTFLCSILDRNDRMTMGASIECRVPFLDYRLVETLAALPSGTLLGGEGSKPLLRRALGERLPARVRSNPKWGFGVPWVDYMRRVPVFRELVESLPRAQPISDGPFDRALLSNVVREFLAGRNRHFMLVRQLLMLAVWHRVYLSHWRANADAELTAKSIA